jgi:aryl-alcohol dehydrogenase (NADP+)
MWYRKIQQNGQATRLIAIARDAGINFIDAANVYNNGKSEEVVGRATSGATGSWRPK